jgi:hypothetical protein
VWDGTDDFESRWALSALPGQQLPMAILVAGCR